MSFQNRPPTSLAEPGSTSYVDGVAERIVRSDVGWLVEAPFGYGKDDLLDRIERMAPSMRLRPVDLDEIPDDRRTVLLASRIDEWSEDDARALTERLSATDLPRFVVTANRCPADLAGVASMIGAERVGTSDLRIPLAESNDRLKRVGTTVSERDALTALIDGWPYLADLLEEFIVRRRMAEQPVTQVSVTHSVVQRAVGRALQGLSDDDRRTSAALAHLAAFDEIVADALARGLWDRLLRAGVPLQLNSSGSSSFVFAIAESLRTMHRLDRCEAKRLGRTMADLGRYIDAARIYARVGLTDQAASTLTSVDPASLESNDPQALLGVLTAIESATTEYPRLDLLRARVHGQRADVERQTYFVERAMVAVGGADVDAVRIDAQVESIYLRSMGGAEPAAVAASIETFPRETLGAHNRARLLESEALVLAHGGNSMQLERSLDLQRQAASIWSMLGERSFEATSLRGQVMTALIPLGRYEDAETAIDAALRLAPGVTSDRVRSLVVLTQILALSGRIDRRAEIAEAASLAHSLGWDWAEAYVAWAAMTIAALQDDAEQVRALGEQAWRSLGVLQAHPTGSVFRAEYAEAAALCGDVELAERLLSDLNERRDECPQERLFAELAIAGARGDAERFEASLEQHLASGSLPDRLVWRVELARGRLIQVCGGDASGVFSQAHAGASRSGAERYVELVASSSHLKSPPVRSRERSVASTDHRAVEIRLLGALRVRVGGVETHLAGTRVRKLLEALALADGHLPVDFLIDRLWPDTDESTGRRRLKNVLARARSAVGDVIVRTTSTVGLHSHVSIDLARFRSAADESMWLFATQDSGAVAAAVQALGLYSGPLLTDDPYDAALEPLRRSLTNRALELLDAVVAHGQEGLLGPFLVETLQTIDPTDAPRLEHVMQWCLDRDRHLSALTAAQRLLVVCDELDLPAPHAAVDLVASVAERSSVVVVAEPAKQR